MQERRKDGEKKERKEAAVSAVTESAGGFG